MPSHPPCLPLNEQIVLVTGGARGLGASLVQAFLRAGARVVINYHTSRQAAEALVDAQAPGRALALQADIGDAAAVRDLVAQARAHFGSAITTLVNNALPAFSFNGDQRPTLAQLDWPAIENQLTALRGALNTTQAVLADMKQHGFGRIINVGTNLFQNPVVPYHDYTAAKAALLAFTRTTAHEVGAHGITVNMISGGLLRTTDASAATPESVFELIATQTPLRRVVTPDEFADTALFFASPWARAVTGQNLVVDGGLVKN